MEFIISKIKHSFFYSLLFLSTAAFCDILGTFHNTVLHPGYLDLEDNAGAFKPNIEEKDRKDGIERRTPSQILKSYLNSDMTFAPKNGSRFIFLVKEFQKNAFLAYCSSKLDRSVSKSNSDCKFIDWQLGASYYPEAMSEMIKKWHKHEAYLTCELAISKMQAVLERAGTVNFRAINHPRYSGFIEDFFTAIEAFEAIRGEDAYWGRSTSMVLYHVKLTKALIKNHHIKSSTKEAANLLIPPEYQERYPNQQFFSPLQLEKLKDDGVDISKFDPPESGLWRKPQIRSKNFNPATYSNEGLASLRERLSSQEIEDLLDPDKEISLEYIPSKDSRGETPKINVSYGHGQKWKLKFLTDKSADVPSTLDPSLAVQRVIISSEVNIEPAVNNLAAAVGFTIDPTYYKKTVRLYFPKEAYEGDFERYLEEDVVRVLSRRFKPSWNTRSAFHKVKIDENGKPYVEFKSVTLEKKSDIKTDVNVSLFVRHGLGKSFKREFRAMALFLALIADPDVKDDNTKIKLVPVKGPDGEETYKLAFTLSDMGISLGLGFPNIYPKKFVSKVEYYDNGDIKDIKLNYKTFFPFPLMQSLSLADAKWLMRMIAQIPRKHIYRIFQSAGYPDVVAKYYQEIFLHRCDQMYEVLGLLGETFTGYNGEQINIQKHSKILDRKRFALKGVEDLFFNGKLEDPHNRLFDETKEHFVRNWGTNLGREIEGQHKAEFYKIFTKGLLINVANMAQKNLVNNFQFTNAFASGPMGNPFCLNRCFFVGLKAGVDWFIPMRFVVDNPTASAKQYPYWVVDMFRLAFVLGDGTQKILANLALVAAPQIVGLGGEFIKGWDFVKIRPVANYADAVGHLKNNDGATRKFFLRDINQQVLEKMQPGDIFVGSSYVSTRGILAIRPVSGTSYGSASAQTQLDLMYLNRTYVLKGHDNKLLTNWASIKGLNLSATGLLYALLIRLPLIRAEFQKSTAKHRVYEFDFNDELARQELLRNINKTNPTHVDPKYIYQTKTVKSNGMKFSFNFFDLNSLVSSRNKYDIVGKDYVTNQEVHAIIYERSKNHRIFKHFEPFDHQKTYIKAQMNAEGDMFARFDLRAYQNQTYKKDFLHIIKKNQAFLPRDFIVFDPTSVKHYLGEFEINSMLVVNKEGIDDLFGSAGPDDLSVCRTYAAVHNVEEDFSDWCQGLMGKSSLNSVKREANKFIKRFGETRRDYQKMRSQYMTEKGIDLYDKKAKNAAYAVLKGIVEMLHDNNHTKKIIDVLQYHINDKNIFRKVSMTSFLEGFPGLLETISNSEASDGGLHPDPQQMLTNIPEVFKIFTDEIDLALDGKLKTLELQSNPPTLFQPQPKHQYS